MPQKAVTDEVMRERGYTTGKDWITRRFDGADHSPRAWRERLHIPLMFLLSNRQTEVLKHALRTILGEVPGRPGSTKRRETVD